jgi:hypothetical protein
MFVQRKGIAPLKGEIIVKMENALKFCKNLLLQNQQAKFNQRWYKLYFGKVNSSLFKSRARSSSKGR